MPIEHYEITGRRNVRVTFHDGEAAESFFCDGDSYWADLNELAEEISREFYNLEDQGYFSAEARCYGVHVESVPFLKWNPTMQCFETKETEECGKVTVTADEDQPCALMPQNVDLNIHQPGKMLIADIMETLSKEIKRGRNPVINTHLCGVAFEIRLLSMSEQPVMNKEDTANV